MLFVASKIWSLTRPPTPGGLYRGHHVTCVRLRLRKRTHQVHPRYALTLTLGGWWNRGDFRAFHPNVTQSNISWDTFYHYCSIIKIVKKIIWKFRIKSLFLNLRWQLLVTGIFVCRFIPEMNAMCVGNLDQRQKTGQLRNFLFFIWELKFSWK